ncbi:MAG: hypothetical protein MR880_03635 [Negativibacillus massiliensis]|nr:hypothetical protein [Negativibacillus massiliensis]
MSDYWEQRKRKERREDTLITILAFLVGIGLMAAGIIGVVTSLMQAEDYENTPDIRTVDAVIESIETKNKKNDNGSLYERHYKLKISYEVDGKTYNGRKDLYAYGNMVDSEKREEYDQLKRGFIIPVEVYQDRNGNYKLADLTTPFEFLVYCAVIPFGLLITVLALFDIFKKIRGTPQEEEDTSGKRRKSKT